jgi:hypothetical protein
VRGRLRWSTGPSAFSRQAETPRGNALGKSSK